MNSTEEATSKQHPNSFAAILDAEVARFAAVVDDEKALIFATQSVAQRFGISYDRAKEVAGFVR